MRLFLKNIGKIGTAAVEINGITVIAGENNTGKSTVGRALFAVFNSFYDIQNKIERERIDSVANSLDRLMYTNVTSRQLRLNDLDEFVELAKNIVRRVTSDQTDATTDSVEEQIQQLMLEYNGESFEGISNDDIKKYSSGIKEVLNISDDNFLKNVMDKKLSAEFNDQICNIFGENTGEIQLEIKGQTFKIKIEDDSVAEIENSSHTSLHTEVIYIDDPFVLDESRRPFFRPSWDYVNHREHLRNKLFAHRGNGNLMDEIVVKDRLENIYDKIALVCSGDIVPGKRAKLGYRRQNSDKILDVRNLSTGLKAFVILKKLLTNGTIESNGTIILDEPEIHLHPEWQLLFAELIVLIQKEFGVHVLLNTHSPYFLRAIQVYSAKYEIADTCKYYLSEVIGEQATITDVTANIDEIYAKLSRPLQKLEDERWQDD